MARVRTVVRLDVDIAAWTREYNGNTGDWESGDEVREQVAGMVSDLVMVGLRHLTMAPDPIITIVEVG
jgi:hypothetical protein